MEYFGFGLNGAYPNRPHAQVFTELMAMLEVADELGLDGWFFAEHHVEPGFSLTPSPNLLIAAAAQRTKRLQLGNMVTVLPFHHPLRVAEEIRMLDVLSQGRLQMGFGRGQVRSEQRAFGTDRDATVDMFDQAVELIKRLLMGDTVDYESPWWRGSQARAIPEATQSPYPPLWMSAASDTSIEKSARLGFNCATALLTRPVADERLAQFRRDWDRYNPGQPGRGKFAITATVAIGRNRQEAYDQVRHEFAARQEHFLHSITDTPGSQDSTYLSHRPTYEAFARATLESLLDNHLLIAGTVEDCQEQVAAIRARGIDVLLGTFHTPQSDFEFSMRSLRLFLTEVIPAVERTPTPAATNAGGVPASA